jgi:thioredoxin-dependent peroxiredoxin
VEKTGLATGKNTAQHQIVKARSAGAPHFTKCNVVLEENEMSATIGLAAGAPAPAFKLPADGGKTLSLTDFASKNLVLYFYPKDDTSGCTAEAIAFNGLRSAFEAANTVIIGVSPDSVVSHDKFKKKHGLAFPLLADEEKAMLEAYGVWVEKSMYGKKYMGVERTTVLIDAAGKVARIWPKVKVPGHAEEVLAAAQAL